jgi:hypothetical protein
VLVFSGLCGLDTRSLTAGVDVVEGGADNDTINGTNLTLNLNDLIVDSSTTDNDTLNLTLSAVPSSAATITNVENINVNLNVFAGTATSFNATNVTGATIVLGSSKLGFDGVAGVTAAGDNNVTAGNNVTSLTVDGLENGRVNAGSAATVAVTTANAADDPTVVVNGDVALTLVTVTDVTIEATADSVITLVKGAATDVIVTGAGNVTLKGDLTGITLVDSLDSGTITVVHTAATGDISGLGDNVTVDAAATALTVTDGQTVALTTDGGGLTVTGSAATDSITLAPAVGLTALTLATVATATIAPSADVTITTLITAGADIVLTGSNDIVITNVDAFVTSIDASALSGELTLDSTVATAAVIIGGAGANSLTIGAATTTSYTGGAVVDTVDATALATGTLAAELGGGDDVVKFGTLGAATVALEGGLGTDTIDFATGSDTTTATTWAVNAFEGITVTDLNGTGNIVGNTLAMQGSQLSGESLTLSILEDSAGNTDDTLVLTVTADAATVDLSGISVADTDAITTVINGDAAVAQTIKGTNADDVITAGGTAVDTVTGGAGSDTFAMTSTAATLSSIVGFTSAATGDNDTLDVTAAVVAAGIAAQDVTGDVTGETGSLTASTDANGLLTLSGLSVDKAAVDTLAEWVAVAGTVSAVGGVASVLAFQFNGNTYVYEDDGSGAETMTVELTGVTGVDGVGGAAADDIILIA